MSCVESNLTVGYRLSGEVETVLAWWICGSMVNMVVPLEASHDTILAAERAMSAMKEVSESFLLDLDICSR